MSPAADRIAAGRIAVTYSTRNAFEMIQSR